MFWWFSIGAMWAAVILNFVTMFRSVREIRTCRAVLQVIWAYDAELRERGVTLPPRCVFCCQILPGHVETCPAEDLYLATHTKLEAWITEPHIKYYRDGSLPPDLGRDEEDPYDRSPRH